MDPDAKRNAWQPDDEHARKFKLSEHRNRDTREKDIDGPMDGLALSEGADRVEKLSKSKSKSPKREKVVKADVPKKEKTEKKEKAEKTEKAEKKDKAEKKVKAEKTEKSEKKEKKEVALKSPKKDKGKDAMSDQSHRAPFELVQKVKKYGRDPLYAYLLPKLDAFKKSDVYKKWAEDWDLTDLIQIPKVDRWQSPNEEDFANIPSQALYDKFVRGETQGAYRAGDEFGTSFLRSNFDDRVSWQCMLRFETMMNEKTTYAEFMQLFGVNIEKLGEIGWDNPYAKENPEAIAALKKCYDKYCDPVSGALKQLSSKDVAESEQMWKEEAIRMDKAERNAEDKAEKALEKEKERIRMDNKGAPSHLFKTVRKYGRDPLYAYLLPKIDAFKKSDVYKKWAEDWDLTDLIQIPKVDRWHSPNEEDFANIPSQALYEKFVRGETQGAYRAGDEFGTSFLRSNFDDRVSWQCMLRFETMMNEKTKYAEFMQLFGVNMEKLGETGWDNPYAKENPEAIAALKKCYDKYKDLNLEAAKELK